MAGSSAAARQIKQKLEETADHLKRINNKLGRIANAMEKQTPGRSDSKK